MRRLVNTKGGRTIQNQG
ncbi:BnaA08g26930D [Brassica napus]|uniref:BnaA08g26930D protein n=2 Tax=Brassica TaxID=3705 RepID=A0A078H2R4_BRANA|nr:BnaA08g26930D [Brassica napus]